MTEPFSRLGLTRYVATIARLPCKPQRSDRDCYTSAPSYLASTQDLTYYDLQRVLRCAAYLPYAGSFENLHTDNKNHISLQLMLWTLRRSMRGYWVLVSIRTVAGYLTPMTCTALNPFTSLLRSPLQHETCELFGNNRSNEVDLGEGKRNIGTTCSRAGPDEYCIYTDPQFNHGEGLSFITTAESMANLNSRPAFNRNIPIRVTDGPYREVDIPGKGRGLVAAKALRTGQKLITRTPALVVNAQAAEKLQRYKLDDLLSRAVDSLPSAHRDQIVQLSAHDNDAKTYEEKVGKIFRTNSFSTGYHDGKSNFRSLFAIGEYLRFV